MPFLRRRGVTPRIQTSLSVLDQTDGPSQTLTTKQGRHPDSTSAPTLSTFMWNESLSFANAALETQFLHGIRHSSLNPEQYGAYCVQDVAYCSNAVDDYDITIEHTQIPEVKDFLQQRRDGYKDYLESSKQTWHIGDPNAIVLNKAAQQYIDFERRVARCENPIYLVVAMIPCSRLWFWLANQMRAYEGTTNVYSFWIRENLQGDGGKKLEDFVDLHSTELDKTKALGIYQNAMICEGNFMRSACNQELHRLFPF